MKNKNILDSVSILIVSLLLSLPVTAQKRTEVPTIGQAIPEFNFPDARNFSSQSINPETLKGKWTVLEFWAPQCTSGIRQFPEASKIQAEMKGGLNWILIGMIDKQYNKDTKVFYEKIKNKYKLSIPYTYDSTVYLRWDIHKTPTILIIDPQGIVRYHPPIYELTLENLKLLVQGNPVKFTDIGAQTLPFDPNKLQANTFTQSKLTQWNGESAIGGYWIDEWTQLPEERRRKGYFIAKMHLSFLYNLAYLGKQAWSTNDSVYTKFFPYPIVQLRDSSRFQFDYQTGKGLYNYFLKMEDGTSSNQSVMESMQQDLRRSFGYVATLEDRTVPIYKLIAGPAAAKKLASKKSETFVTEGNTMFGFKARNYPKSKLLSWLTFYIEASDELIPYFQDLTGISDAIDIEVEGDLSTLNGVRQAIKPYDLYIIKTTAVMKTIVIRDAN